MKAILEFNLPEDRVEHLWAVKSGRMAGDICEAMNQMRNWLKHGHEFKNADDAIEACSFLLTDVSSLALGEE